MTCISPNSPNPNPSKSSNGQSETRVKTNPTNKISASRLTAATVPNQSSASSCGGGLMVRCDNCNRRLYTPDYRYEEPDCNAYWCHDCETFTIEYKENENARISEPALPEPTSTPAPGLLQAQIQLQRLSQLSQLIKSNSDKANARLKDHITVENLRRNDDNPQTTSGGGGSSQTRTPTFSQSAPQEGSEAGNERHPAVYSGRPYRPRRGEQKGLSNREQFVCGGNGANNDRVSSSANEEDRRRSETESRRKDFKPIRTGPHRQSTEIQIQNWEDEGGAIPAVRRQEKFAHELQIAKEIQQLAGRAYRGATRIQ